MPPTRVALLALALLSFGAPLSAQLVVKLSPRTLDAFEGYAAKVQGSFNERWNGTGTFLEIESHPDALAECLRGELAVTPMGDPHPLPIPDGLIHDWAGTVFIANTKVEEVLAILEDFDNHQKIYPSVAQSRTLQRTGHEVTGFWQLRQKGMVPVILDVVQEVKYQQRAPGKWSGQAYARKIIETDTTPFGNGSQFPPDQGHGYLWRLYSYWTLEAREGGVLTECRTLSLSRDIPQGLAWAVGPYVTKTPRNSLISTLEQTRKAVSRLRR